MFSTLRNIEDHQLRLLDFKNIIKRWYNFSLIQVIYFIPPKQHVIFKISIEQLSISLFSDQSFACDSAKAMGMSVADLSLIVENWFLVLRPRMQRWVACSKQKVSFVLIHILAWLIVMFLLSLNLSAKRLQKWKHSSVIPPMNDETMI